MNLSGRSRKPLTLLHLTSLYDPPLRRFIFPAHTLVRPIPPELRSRCAAALLILEQESALQEAWSQRITSQGRQKQRLAAASKEVRHLTLQPAHMTSSLPDETFALCHMQILHGTFQATIETLRLQAARGSLQDTLRRRQESVQTPHAIVDDLEEPSAFFMTSIESDTRRPSQARALRVNPLGLYGSRGTLWDAESPNDVASRAGILVTDDDIVAGGVPGPVDRAFAGQEDADDGTSFAGADDDEDLHRAATSIQRIARGRIGSEKANCRADEERAREYRETMRGEALHAGQETAATFFRSLLSGSHEVRKAALCLATIHKTQVCTYSIVIVLCTASWFRSARSM